MPIEVLMPALSPTMEKGNLAKWHKKEGDAVKSGDVIAEIETDKATMEVEAVDEGTLGKILVPEGTNDVAVNTPIAMILGEGEDASTVTDGAKRKLPPAKAGEAGQAERDAKGAEAAPRRRDDDKQTARSSAPTVTIAPSQPALLPESEVPEGTEMVTMTV